MSEIVAAVSLHYMAGDSVELEFTVTLDDEPLSLSGMTIRFAIARRVGADAVVSTEDETATVTVTDTEGGVFQVLIEPDDTEGLSGTYRFEAEIEDSSGGKSTVSRGFITFQRNLI